jgi:hypothetical protein
MRGVRTLLALPVIAALAVGLTGCLPAAAPTPTHSAHATLRAAHPTATPTPVPTYNPRGTARQNLAYFDRVGQALFASSQGAAASTQGELIVNWFVAHGFTKANMEVTPDKTSIGLAAWNIEFSVKMNKSCLIGQAGNVGFQSTAQPLLATGKCLIGLTRPIDW